MLNIEHALVALAVYARGLISGFVHLGICTWRAGWAQASLQLRRPMIWIIWPVTIQVLLVRNVRPHAMPCRPPGCKRILNNLDVPALDNSHKLEHALDHARRSRANNTSRSSYATEDTLHRRADALLLQCAFPHFAYVVDTQHYGRFQGGIGRHILQQRKNSSYKRDYQCAKIQDYLGLLRTQRITNYCTRTPCPFPLYK